MSTRVGRIEQPPAVTAAQAAGGDGKTRAQLVEEAEALGVTVPPKASKAQVADMIAQARLGG